MVDLARPWTLLLAPVVLYLEWKWRRVRNAPSYGFFPGRGTGLIGSGTRVFSGLAPHLRLGVLTLLVVALAGPGVTRALPGEGREGVAVMSALDLSGSMMVEDMSGRQRLQVAREELRRFTVGLPGVQIGLVTFAGEAFTRIPLSPRHNQLLAVLEDLEGAVVDDGTALGEAVGVAANRLRNVPARSRVLVLLTDGANNSGAVDPLTAARMAHELGVKIFCVGVGADSGRGVLDEDLLSRMASVGGGRYYRAESREGLEEVLREIGDMEATPLEAGSGTFHPSHGVFLFLAAVLLLVEGLVRASRLTRLQ